LTHQSWRVSDPEQYRKTHDLHPLTLDIVRLDLTESWGRKVADTAPADKLRLTSLLRDSASSTHRLLAAWSNIPLLLMQEIDWERGPLVLIGFEDLMMWPLLPPGTLLQLDQKKRRVSAGSWTEFERPVYLIEYGGRFQCCHAQRRGDSLLLISHADSPRQPITSVPYKKVRVRGQLTPIFRPLATRDGPVGRSTRWQRDT
jgi:hypothetical protein